MTKPPTTPKPRGGARKGAGRKKGSVSPDARHEVTTIRLSDTAAEYLDRRGVRATVASQIIEEEAKTGQ